MSAAKKTKQRARSPQRTAESPLRNYAVCAVLVVLVWIVFGQTLGHDFVNYDDKTYVYGNSLVSGGLSWPAIGKAFVDTQTNNWHPLTLISHMLDCQLFGLKAGGHHFTNVLLHAIAAVLLFLWLRNLTNAFWPSAFVASVFAIHPLRVESVAWIAERKDVLSAFFFFLTLIAYLRYVRAPSVARYATISILFACGLMSKVMLVTLPAVLLLLDYWPRFAGANFTAGLREREDANRSREAGGSVRGTERRKARIGWPKLILEKIPLVALSIAAAIITFILQIHSSTSVDQLPFSWRVENALVACVTYIWQIFWPANLAVFYPHPDDTLTFWQFGLAGVFLVGMSWLAIKLREKRPYFFVGWFWYLIMLVPVIGIVQVGLQGHADRYTYLPHVGLYIAIAWAIADLSRSIPHRKEILATAGVLVIIALSACAYKQATYWRNSETLWTRAIAVTKGNDVALSNLGGFYLQEGRIGEAQSSYEQAVAVRPASAQRHYSLSLAVIQNSLGNVLARNHRLKEAIEHMRESIRLRPDYPDSHYNLATVLFQTGDVDGAISEWRTMLSLRPQDANVHTSFANALVEKGLLREAADHYQKALQIGPNSILALNNLAWIMSVGPDDSLRNNTLGLNLALKANELSHESNSVLLRTLAAAYAEAGQFDNAIKTAERAAQIAHDEGRRDLENRLEQDVDLYRRQTPLRDPSL